MYFIDGKYVEIIEQIYEIVWIDNICSWKVIFQFFGDIFLIYQGLYDGGIMSKFFVFVNQYLEFFVVYVYVVFYYFLWCFVMQNIVFDKIENYVGIVQGSFFVVFWCEVVVVILWFYDIYQLVDGMVEWIVCGIICQYFMYFFFCEFCYFVEFW